MNDNKTDAAPHSRVAADEEIDWFVAARSLDHETEQDWGSDHYSPQLATGLGREAVICAGNDIDTFGPWLFNKDGDVYTDGIAVDVNQYRSAFVESARKQLESLKPKQKVAFEALLHGRDMPLWLNELVGLDETDMSDLNVDKASPLIAKLTQKAEDGTYTVGERTFLNFLEWHNYQLAQEQKKFDLQREGYVGGFEDEVRTAVEDGWMPGVALERLEHVRDATIVVDDGLTTEVFDTIGLHAAGLGHEGRDLIVLAPGEPGSVRRHVLYHEATHVISGSGETRWGAGVLSYAISELFQGKRYGTTAIVEACTEHIASALGGHAVDKLGVNNNKIADAYSVERKLLEALCEKGVQRVDIRLFINALMEDARTSFERGADSANAQLANALKEAFPGRNVLDEVAQLEGDKDLRMLNWNLREDALQRKNLAGKLAVGYMHHAPKLVKMLSRRKAQNKQV